MVDSGRAPVSRSSPLGGAALPEPPTISLSIPLPITTLPVIIHETHLLSIKYHVMYIIFPFQVFNLAAPTPVMNGVGRADGNETEQSEKATKLTEKEENNNKKNKRPLEEEKAVETRKKATTDGGPKPIFEIPPFGGNSDFSSVGGSPKAGKAASGGSSKLDEAAVTQTFTFRPPTTVITQVLQSLLVFGRVAYNMDALQASLAAASVEYHFSLPTPIVIQQEVKSLIDPDFFLGKCQVYSSRLALLPTLLFRGLRAQ